MGEQWFWESAAGDGEAREEGVERGGEIKYRGTPQQFFNIYLEMQGRAALVLVCAWLWLQAAHCQFAPIWQASPYIEARSLVIVSNGQKVTGTYTLPVLFSTLISSPALALAIPQLRVIADGSLGFRHWASSPSSTGFTHNLDISGATTIIYYMQARYIAFNTVVLTKEFQTYSLVNQTDAAVATGPTPAARSSNFSVTLTPAAVLANSPQCLAFLAGVTATSSGNYQVNMSCVIDNTLAAVVMVTVYGQTVLAKLSFYVVAWDPVILAAQSFLFVDSAVTTTYYNVQRSQFTLPYGYLEKGYMGGMASFSTYYQQELNFTLSALALATSQTSLFDSAPQLQVRVRNCSSLNYPMFNKADQLCYPVCPAYTYAVAAAFLCTACPTNCLSCLDSTTCTSCAPGMSVVGSVCVCNAASYLSGSICIGCHYSCLTCAATGQYYNCLSCDPAAHRSATPVVGFNSKCECDAGYVDSGSATCKEICGDGLKLTDPCDDSNTASGDGCSSSCTVEANFTCPATAGMCFYTGAVSIELVKIFKEDYEDKFNVYLKVSPWIGNMALLANAISLDSNFTKGSPVDYAVERDLLVYSFVYKEEIEGEVMEVYLKPLPGTIFAQLPPTNCSFELTSYNGFELKMYTKMQYQVAGSFHYLAMIEGYLILASAFLYIFGRLKWLGNLLFFSLQFQYLSMVIIPRFTPMLAGLSMIKTVMGFNEIFGQEEFDLPKYPSLGVLNFNKQYDYNVNVMVALQGLALLMYLFYHVTYRRNELLCRKYGGDPEKTYRALPYGKLLQFFDWEFFMFWTFFNMVNQLVATVLYTELPQPEFLPLLAFNLLCMVLAVGPLLVRRKQVKSYTELLYCKDRGHEESLVSLFAYLMMFALLGVALTVSKVIYYLLFLFPVGMMVYVCCRRPFQSKWMRAAYFVNCLCIMVTLAYNLLTIALEDSVYYLPFGSLITIMVDWVFNLIVWGREAYVICKYGGERDLNEVLASNTKTSSNDNNQEDFFRDNVARPAATNQPLLNSIIKQQAKTKRVSRREQFDEDTPSGIREQKMAQLAEEEQEERADLKKRREHWAKEMKDVKEASKLRERTRHELDSSTFKRTLPRTKVRTTDERGIDEAQLHSVL